LRVVTQPQFIHERGDAYLRDVDAAEHAHLYRLRSFLDNGVPLAAGSDAPYGDPDPWKAMASAVARRTRDGASIGPAESLTPEQALGLFMAPLNDPGAAPREVRVGTRADLCLLDRSWAEAREALQDVVPQMTWIRGAVAWDAGEFL